MRPDHKVCICYHLGTRYILYSCIYMCCRYFTDKRYGKLVAYLKIVSILSRVDLGYMYVCLMKRLPGKILI